MRNIIIDSFMHSPYFKHVYGNNIEYVTCTVPYRWIQPYYNKAQFKLMYGYEPKCYLLDNKELKNSTEEFDNLFITYPLVDLEPDRHPNFYKEYGEYLQEIHKFFSPKIKGKIIIIDNHDLPLNEESILKSLGIKYDILLKKEYNLKCEEGNLYGVNIKNIFPFPYVVLGMNDCMYILNNKQRTGSVKDTRCFWSGSINSANESRYYLNYDRGKYLNECSDIIYNYPYNGSPEYGNETYLNAMSNFKFSLYLKGAATLTRRFFEILSTNSLMLMEEHDVVIHVDGNHPTIAEECIFTNPEELKIKHRHLIQNQPLYFKCLDQQIRARRIFYYDFIKDYINSIIDKIKKQNENSSLPLRVL